MLSSDKGDRLRSAIYCRISLARFGDLVKVERQEADCRSTCDRLGWDVADVFVDPNKSAWQRNRKRPGWDALLEGVRDKRFDAIVVYHGDRLIRQPWDLEMLLRVADEQGVRLASPTGTRNLDNADDRFVLRIEAAQACRESDNASRRRKRAIEAWAADGKPRPGGIRPFGFERDLVTIREAEAEIIRDLAARILAGDSTSSLVKDLNRRGITTSTGRPWYHLGLKHMMCSPRLAGLITLRGEIAGPGSWDAILERETWEAVRSILDSRAQAFAAVVPPRKHLLTGIAACGSCDSPLAVRRSGGAVVYGCMSLECPRRVMRSMEHLDEYVISAVLTRLADDRLWSRVAGVSQDGGMAAELAAVEARKRQIVEEFADDDVMDPALLRGMLRRLDERIAGLRARIAAQRGTHILDGLRDLTREGWDGLPLDRRRAVVRELVTVRVAPSKRGPGFHGGAFVSVERREV
jgi:site-specific DNA recombinase